MAGDVGARTPVSRMVVDVAASFMLLTRIPVPWERVSDVPPDFGRSAWANPVVGLVVGAIGGGVLWGAAAAGAPPLVAALLAILAQCLATGAFHEDGLADVADGFGGGLDRAGKLEIMKDSRVGTYGALALIFTVAVRAAAVAAPPAATGALALIAAGAASRATIAVLPRFLPNVRPDGLGAAASPAGTAGLVVAVVLGAAPAVALLGWMPAGRSLAAGVVAAALLARTSFRQIGGFTGDVLGAAQQAFEIFFLVAVAAGAP